MNSFTQLGMAASYDVLVLGLGAMGSACAFHLARRGARVLGVDRFAPPHTQGSSHGQTRIIREAYFEDPVYVPIVQRAYVLWEELQKQTDQPLLLPTGGIMIGPPDGVMVAGAQRSAETHGLVFERLNAAEIRQRFPVLHPRDDMAGIWEPRAGILFPERCVQAHLEEARRCGAEMRVEERVISWQPDGAGVEVRTEHDVFRAGQLIVTAGSWLPSLCLGLPLALTVERQTLFWFAPPAGADFLPERCPVHLWEVGPESYFYGFPDVGQGVKVARHHQGLEVDPETVGRGVSIDEGESMERYIEPYLPRLTGYRREAVVCLYTNTPDGHFLIDWHPEWPQVMLASPCSGHGFKFSSAIGEILAELALYQRSRFDLHRFRFGGRAS